jgi:hypothetical protein
VNIRKYFGFTPSSTIIQFNWCKRDRSTNYPTSCQNWIFALSNTIISWIGASAIALQLIPLPALVLSDRTFSYTTSTSDRSTTYPTAKPVSSDRTSESCPFTHLTRSAIAFTNYDRPTDYPTAKPVSSQVIALLNYVYLPILQNQRSHFNNHKGSHSKLHH